MFGHVDRLFKELVMAEGVEERFFYHLCLVDSTSVTSEEKRG